jgi:putative alpha-1,2-mannosidase
VNTPLFDRAEIALPAGKSIRISAPGASNGPKFIDGLSIDGQPTDQTFLPESMIGTGGDVSFSLSAIPDLLWGSAESSAPPSFGVGSST